MIFGTLLFLFSFLSSTLAATTTNLTLAETYSTNQHILNDYTVNTNGYITLIKTTQDTFDRLILVDGKKGKIHYNKKTRKIQNPNVLVKKGVLANLTSLEGQVKNQHFKGFRLNFKEDSSAAKAVFEFLADNTSIEWSLLHFSIKNQSSNLIYTSYRPDLEYFGSVKVHHLLNYSEIIKSLKHYHNHPREPIEAIGKYAFPSNADLDFRNKVLKKGIQSVDFIIRTDSFYVNYSDPEEWNKGNGEDFL